MRRHPSRRWTAGLPASLLLAAALVSTAAVRAADPPATPPAAAPAAAAAQPADAGSAQVPVESFTLPNGMTFLLVRKPELPTISAGWVAHVGSANERPGITGLSHFFEHMMFKGTRTIGTKDPVRDLAIIEEQEKVQTKIRALYAAQRERWRRGEIADPYDPAARPPELVSLEEQFQKLVEEQRSLMIKDEIDKLYTEAGATGMNAGTFNDMTIYFVTVPANKLELWFWIESDRLLEPVFREFYSERDVVHEERRMRTESTPTGRYDEQLDSMFWVSHPYTWPVVGWPSDLRSYSLAQAQDYFATYYAPNNVVAALVGNFDPAEVKRLAEKYFGRIAHGQKDPPDVVTMEVPQLAEMRMDAECDCQPQLQVKYHTVPLLHKDSYALDVLAGILNGRSGRLYKSMVLGKEIASSASASQDSRRWAGSFDFAAETKGDATPAQLEAAWSEELARVQNEPVPAEELQKVKNQIAADAFRRLESPFFLMLQLCYYEGLGDWRYLNEWADKTLAVTAEDVQRVAKQYFTKENRTVAVYTRKAGTAAEAPPPELAALPPEVQGQVKQQIQQIRQVDDPARLEGLLQQLAAQKGGAPPQFKPVMDLLEKVARERLEQLKAAGAGGDGTKDGKQGGGAR